MRRFTVTILFLLLLVMGLFGSDIVAYGYGSTEAMARKAAFDALSQMVFGDVEVFSDESFEPLPSVIQEVWLTAEKAEQKKGIYCSSATIPESAAETFFSEMEKLNSEIVHGYASLSGMEDYFSLIDCMVRLDGFRFALSILGSKTNVPEAGIHDNTFTLLCKLRNLVITQDNELEITLGSSSKDFKARLKDSQALEERILRQMELSLDIGERIRERSVEKQVHQVLDSVPEEPSVIYTGLETIEEIMDDVILFNSRLSTVLKQYDTIVQKANKRTEEVYTVSIAALDAIGFRNSDKKASEARAREKGKIQERRDAEMARAKTIVQDAFGPVIGGDYTHYMEALERLEGRKFNLNTDDGSLSVEMDSFDETNHRWLFSARPGNLSAAIVYNVALDFNVLDKKGYEKYKADKYQEAVELYKQKLSKENFQANYMVTADVTPVFDKVTGVLGFTVGSLTFRDKARKKNFKLQFMADSEDEFYESHVRIDISQYAFALSGKQLKAFNKETAEKRKEERKEGFNSFVDSFEFYALASGRLGLGYIPEDKRQGNSPVGYFYDAGADVFLKIGPVVLGVNPHFGKALDQRIVDLYYSAGFEIIPDRSGDKESSFIMVRYGRNRGNRFEIAFRSFKARDDGKTADLSNYMEAGLILYPEFNYIPGVFVGFGLGVGVGK